MARSVLILGYAGVQALDLVGPSEVFTGATLYLQSQGRADAIETEPGGAHSIPELARRAAMSPRHFTRVFTVEVGEAPGAYVERIRTEAARRQLEETDDTVTVIASRCGFGTAETLRRNFVRRVGISPDQYRKTFA
jgi:transcriptional regulator GlxA family with amidase domain